MDVTLPFLGITNFSSLGTDLFQTTIDSWAEVTSWDLREA
jgi:hypothetical protein